MAHAPAVVVVSGEAGIGKTRLVDELPTADELAGRRFVAGSCRRIREPFPLGPVIDAVRSLGDVLAGARLSAVAGSLRPLLPEIAHLLPPRPEPGGLALARGDRAGARDRLEAIFERPNAGVVDQLPLLVAERVRLAIAEDDVATAVRLVAQLRDAVAEKGIWAPVGQALPAVTDALVVAGRLAEAGELIDRYAEETAALDVPLAPAAIAYARGALAEAAGDLRAAAEEFRAAAQCYTDLLCGYEAAWCAEALARCLLGHGDQAEARRRLREAADTYQRLGARWDLDRVASLARRNAVSLPGQYRGGKRGYGERLSPRERAVAELAAEGRTNKEIAAALFLSAKTVDKHLGAALGKLGVRSRVALAGRFAASPPENGESSP